MRFQLALIVATLLLDGVTAKSPIGAALGKIPKAAKGGSKPNKASEPVSAATDESVGKPSGTASAGGGPPKGNPCNIPGASTVTPCTITTGPTSTTALSTSTCSASDSACNNCALALITLEACSSAVPGFVDASDSDEAKCVCYNPAPNNASSLIWVPNQFDVPYSGCPMWAKTADPSNQAILASATNFCHSIGNVWNATSTDTATIPASSVEAAGSTGASNVLASGTSVGPAMTSVSATASTTGKSAAGNSFQVSMIGLAFGVGLGGVLAF